jgi:hypothetical protein
MECMEVNNNPSWFMKSSLVYVDLDNSRTSHSAEPHAKDMQRSKMH